MFNLPACAALDDLEEDNCRYVLQDPYGLSEEADCSILDNALRISNVYPDYASSNASALSFSLNLSRTHSCTPQDYVCISAENSFSGNVLESATVSQHVLITGIVVRHLLIRMRRELHAPCQRTWESCHRESAGRRRHILRGKCQSSACRRHYRRRCLCMLLLLRDSKEDAQGKRLGQPRGPAKGYA